MQGTSPPPMIFYLKLKLCVAHLARIPHIALQAGRINTSELCCSTKDTLEMTFNDQTDQIIISATIVQGLTAVRT